MKNKQIVPQTVEVLPPKQNQNLPVKIGIENLLSELALEFDRGLINKIIFGPMWRLNIRQNIKMVEQQTAFLRSMRALRDQMQLAMESHAKHQTEMESHHADYQEHRARRTRHSLNQLKDARQIEEILNAGPRSEPLNRAEQFVEDALGKVEQCEQAKARINNNPHLNADAKERLIERVEGILFEEVNRNEI